MVFSVFVRVVLCLCFYFFFFSSRRRHTSCALVTGVQTCALPICPAEPSPQKFPYVETVRNGPSFPQYNLLCGGSSAARKSRNVPPSRESSAPDRRDRQ